MKKIGIFYGSTTGITAEVAEDIADALGVDKKDLHTSSEQTTTWHLHRIFWR